MQTVERTKIGRLVGEFARCVLDQEEALRNSDPKTGNKLADKRSRIFTLLRSKYGDKGRQALATLLSHVDDDVRSTAAVWLLRYCHHEAMQVLQDVSKNSSGLTSFAAAQAIKRWEEGDWHLDPAPEEEDTV
jgi:uncharacterized protein DUF2019